MQIFPTPPPPQTTPNSTYLQTRAICVKIFKCLFITSSANSKFFSLAFKTLKNLKSPHGLWFKSVGSWTKLPGLAYQLLNLLAL